MGYQEDGQRGNFILARYNSGKFSDYNPAVMVAPVAAQLGGFFNQVNSYDMAFANMDTLMSLPYDTRTALKLRNRYASSEGKLNYEPSDLVPLQ